MRARPIGEINRELFRKKARSRIVLEAMITSNMKFYYDGAVAVATITKAMLEKTGATENDLDDVAAIPGSIAEVIVARYPSASCPARATAKSPCVRHRSSTPAI